MKHPSLDRPQLISRLTTAGCSEEQAEIFADAYSGQFLFDPEEPVTRGLLLAELTALRDQLRAEFRRSNDGEND